MTLLQKRDLARRQRRLSAWTETRGEMASALHELLPGSRVIIFGSLSNHDSFTENSDVDIALFEEPSGRTMWALQADLEEKLRRPIDLVLLSECRFREKILREGEIWTT